MSASNKKKLRKEQNMAAMTEKQQQALKDAKKLKAYTLTFVVVMALVVAIMVGILVRTPIAGAISRGTHSVTIGNHKLSTADLSYYYIDTILNHYNQYSSYGDYASMYALWLEGIDFSKPMDEQTYDEESGQTWADYYIDEAIETARTVYALYDAAMADPDFSLSEDDQDYLDAFEDYVEMYASLYGYSSAAGYLRNYYGDGANLKTYKTYNEVSLIASEYYDYHMESIEYTDTDYRTYEADKYDEYSCFSYAIHEIVVSDYLSGGTTTTDEDGKETTVYSDSEKLAAENLAKADAEALAIAGNNTVELLNAAIQALEINKNADAEADTETETEADDTETETETEADETEPVTATEKTDVFYSKISNEDLQAWLADASRVNGNITVIENTTTSTDDDGNETETITGFYVVLFLERDDNLMKLQNVRHILAEFEGGEEDDETGETVYSVAEKAAAKAEAEEILNEWLALETKDAEAFGELANEKSDDGDGTTGGLYEDIYPGKMKENFEKWCFDESRQEGDVEIIETEYGFHIMYYVGESDITYRDYMIDADMLEEDMEAWETGLTDAMTVTKVNLKGINKEFTVS